MKYENKRKLDKARKSYELKLGEVHGSRYKLLEENYYGLVRPQKFAITKMTSKEIQDTFYIEPYALINSIANYRSLKQTKITLKEIKIYIQDKYNTDVTISKEQCSGGFFHTFINFKLNGKAVKIMYVDETYYKKENGQLIRNSKYNLFTNKLYYHKIKLSCGKLHTRYIDGLIEMICNKN